ATARASYCAPWSRARESPGPRPGRGEGDLAGRTCSGLRAAGARRGPRARARGRGDGERRRAPPGERPGGAGGGSAARGARRLGSARGPPRRTGAAVGGLRARWEADRARHEQLFDEVAAVVEAGARAAEAGDLPALGRAFDENQALLGALGVSAPEVEALVAAARGAGALGAKLTGGRAGGAVIALAAEPERVAATLQTGRIETIV